MNVYYKHLNLKGKCGKTVKKKKPISEPTPQLSLCDNFEPSSIYLESQQKSLHVGKLELFLLLMFLTVVHLFSLRPKKL